MADALARAGRSGAPAELLDGMLANYATAQVLDEDDVQAIASALALRANRAAFRAGR